MKRAATYLYALVPAVLAVCVAGCGGSAPAKPPGGTLNVYLSLPKPGDETWDPSTVEANAKRAAADPDAIAYIGELDEGASAISVPVTNDAGILQVSPFDGLTSLTRDEPGTPLTNGPARYYPSGT